MLRFKRVEWILIAVSLVVATAAGAATTRPTGKPLELRYQFEAGQEFVYEQRVSSQSQLPDPMMADQMTETDIQRVVRVVVVSVDDDGTATIESTISTQPDPDGQAPGDEIVVSRVASDGTLLDDGRFPMAGAGVPLAPRGVRPGEQWTWTQEQEIEFGPAAAVTGTSRFEGYEQTAFGRAARIRTDMSAPIDWRVPAPAGAHPSSVTGTMRGTMVTLLLVGDATLVSSSQEIVTELTMEAAATPGAAVSRQDMRHIFLIEALCVSSTGSCR